LSAVAAAAVALSATAFAAAPAQAATSKGWKVVKTVKSTGIFWDTAASSWWNAWAVGGPGAWRWNGHTWAKVAIPSSSHQPSEVSTSGTGNTWVLNPKDATPLRRWSKGKWSAAAAAHGAGVQHIGAAGARQVWASGDGFLRHYDGSAWSDKKLPGDVTIAGIDVNHYNDVWAVGYRKTSDGNDQPYAMHWNGSAWTTTPVPEYHVGEPDWNVASLRSVAFVGTNDVYAAGDVEIGENVYSPVLVHWNGTKWSKVSVPKAVHPAYGVNGIAPVGGGGTWYSWDARHIERRTPSGTWTDYKVTTPSGAPTLYGITHIPGTKSSLTVGRSPSGAVIMLGK